MAGVFGWDYPAGAEHDPNAPWNQPDYSTKSFEITFMEKYPEDFQYYAECESGGGYQEWSGPELLEDCDEEEIYEYFEQFEGTYTKELVESKEFQKMADRLFEYVVGDDWEWEFPEDPRDEGDYYYDLRKDEPDYFD